MRKVFHMSFKKFSSAQDAASQNKTDSKPKEVPAIVKPTGGNDKAPAEGASAPKS